MKPKVISQPRVPTNLSDDARHPPLYGNYSNPLPADIEACQREAKNRGKDVINLLIAIRNNNAEMKAIRQLNK